MKLFCERLAYALKVREKSPAALARAVGATESAVSQWLSGETKSMRAANLVATCQFLRCQANWLASNKGPSGLDGLELVTPAEPAPAWPFQDVQFARWDALNERHKGRVEAVMNAEMDAIEMERKQANGMSM